MTESPAIEEWVEELGNGKQRHAALYPSEKLFRLILREKVTAPDGKGGVVTESIREVFADHVMLEASGMEERNQLVSDLSKSGWKMGHISPTAPWMVVYLQGDRHAELVKSRESLLRQIPESVKLTEDEVVRANIIPNDSYYVNNNLYGMQKIEADRAWDIADGGGEVLIGICDSGVQTSHPDLAANIWTNRFEIPNNGIDDDNNGFVDDVNGWNFVSNTNDIQDVFTHGTHVAGTAAGVGFNSLGVIGAAPRARIVACKILSDAGSGSMSSVYAAHDYLIALRRRGEFVASQNLSIGQPNTILADYKCQPTCTNGITICWSAGNEGADLTGNVNGVNNTPYVLYVAWSDQNDALATGYPGSNYGLDWCDLAAPGEGINSTLPGGAYGANRGTSMAAPHAAGVAALVASANRSLTAFQVMHIMTNTVDRFAVFSGKLTSGGRLNAFDAVRLAKTYPDVTLVAPADGGTVVQNQTVTLVARTQITSNTVTAVRFYNNGVLLGSDSTPADGWTCDWTPTSIEAKNDITCEADDNAGHTTRTWWRSRVSVAGSAPATPSVSIQAIDDFAAEPYDDGLIVIRLSSAAADALTIPLTVSGTATAGVDYAALPTSVAVPAGTLTAELPVSVINDFVTESIETVTVALGAGAGYTVSPSSNATVWVHDDETQARPIIVQDPVGVSVVLGEAFTFSVSVAGSLPLSAQWKKNSTAIVGATSTNYTISSVSIADLGVYSCLVTNTYGSAESGGAVLSLAPVSSLPVSGITPNAAVLNAGLSGTGATVNVYAFWSAINGGTNAAAWANSAFVKTWSGTGQTNVSYGATGLLQDTRYYFTFCHSNAAGRTWAPRVLDFQTMGAVAVDNSAGATNTAVGASALRGTVTDGGSVDVRVYWGTADGGANPAAWQNVAVLSNLTIGAFSANISNLLYGLTYYYRCQASNSIDSAWAPASSSFTTLKGVFRENFDGVVAPQLPAGWTTGGTTNWITRASSNDTAPNAVFVPDQAVISSNALISPVFKYLSSMGPLSFRHYYICEGGTSTAYDGGVLDIKIGSNPWQDIITAGGVWVSGGYNKTVSSTYQNPLAGRLAWSGNSGGFVTTKVTLPAAAAGQEIQLRWLLGTDNNTAATGWYVDSIAVGSGGIQIGSRAATNVTVTTATLQGMLSCSGAVVDVYAHWNKVNGGTSTAKWTNSAYAGTWTNCSATISNLVEGLNPNTVYYFTFRGSNACEQVWATNVLSFTTLVSLSAPVVDNGQGPTDATVNECRLNGLLGDGGVAEAWICWGGHDAGMLSTGDWDHVVSVGTVYEGAPFSAMVSGLSTNATYWYRCFVKNDSGSDWDDGAKSFSGLPAGGGGAVGGVLCAGGVITNYLINGTYYTAHSFTNNGTLTSSNTVNAEVLVVAGGGGGGANGGGGGGAGGLLYTNSYPLTNSQTIAVTIGGGGTGGANGGIAGTAGGNTVFGSMTTIGGGGGSSRDGGNNAGIGGSGGGGGGADGTTRYLGASGTAGQGNSGGNGAGSGGASNTGGGGGGAGAAGTAGVSLQAGNGGTGLQFAGFAPSGGSPAGWFAGGGAGGKVLNGSNGLAGTNGGGGSAGTAGVRNSGGGGGGGGPSAAGGKGGAGIVIVRYCGSRPTIQNTAPTAITNISATFNATFSAPTTNYDVFVHWGQTDGGTDEGLWTENSQVGSWTNVASTNISFLVSGLSAGTTYYYMFRATNAGTNVWATPSWQFMTTGASGGSSNNSLGVVSAHGGANPGSSVAPSGTVFNCSIVNSPVNNGTTQYFCTGWTMTGNSPFSGTGTNFVMTLTNNATLTWQWTTTYWIDLNVTGN